MYEKEKQELIKCGMEMLRYGLVSLTGGNVSLRLDDGTFLVTPSAMLYEDMERQAVRRMVRQAQKEQQTLQKKKSEQER